jgi:phosphoglycerol transferase MdoB-like AlkP superfamily enzyme
LDIMPSILDLVGYDGTIQSFGQSLFRRDRSDRAVQFMGGQYRLIQEDRLLLFDGEKEQGLYAYESDSSCAHDVSAQEPERLQRLTQDLKAIIQRHADMLTGGRPQKR